jgi:putative tricarboxylic transport membrane protein
MFGPIILAGSALLALYLGRGLEMWSFGAPGSGLLPTLAALILLVASLASFQRKADNGEEAGNFPCAAAYAAGLIAIPPAVMLLGMLPALALFTVLILRLVERFRILPVLLITGASVLGNWIVFEKLLNVPLPKPGLW